MKSLKFRISMYMTILLLAFVLGLASESSKNKPLISIEQAILLAKNYVKEHKIDVSKSYIDSAKLNLNPRGDRGPFWLITWEPNAHYSAYIKAAGGQVFLNIYMDQQIEIRYGE